MTGDEARTLMKQLGAPYRGHSNKASIADLEAHCEKMGLEIALENATGAWVVLDAGKNVKARCD